MSLEVIGAGFGRTGTESMKRALEMLGHGPCYHMYEVMPHPERYATWQAIYDGRQSPDWDQIFDGFRATVDWPACRYWRELAAHFPDAKILLTYRDPQSWYESMERTILPMLRDPERTEGMAPRLRRVVFGGEVHDQGHVISVYKRHVEDVQAVFGADRLLTYELGSGWDPLCRFLGRDVPPAPFPTGNDTKAFHANNQALGAQRKADDTGSQNTLANSTD